MNRDDWTATDWRGYLFVLSGNPPEKPGDDDTDEFESPDPVEVGEPVGEG